MKLVFGVPVVLRIHRERYLRERYLCVISEWWMVADTELPSIRKLIIYGTLELEPNMDFVLNATYIFVGPDANLIIGWPDQPMEGRVVISLHGDWDTPDMMLQGTPYMGAKAIGKE
jgi:hypothetical protein